MKIPFDLNFVIYIIYYVVIIIPFSPCDLDMKIPIGRGGLRKTFNGINNHVIS